MNNKVGGGYWEVELCGGWCFDGEDGGWWLLGAGRVVGGGGVLMVVMMGGVAGGGVVVMVLNHSQSELGPFIFSLSQTTKKLRVCFCSSPHAPSLSLSTVVTISHSISPFISLPSSLSPPYSPCLSPYPSLLLSYVHRFAVVKMPVALLLVYQK